MSSSAVTKQRISDTPIEFAVFCVITTVGCLLARYFTSAASGWYLTLMASAIFYLQAKFTKRNYIAHIPILSACLTWVPYLAILWAAMYAVITSMSTGYGTKRTALIISSELVATGLVLILCISIPHTRLYIAAPLYLAFRLWYTVLGARITGAPVDIGAISGANWLWRAITTVLLAQLLIAINLKPHPYHFLQEAILGLGWILVNIFSSKSDNDFGRGIAGMAYLLGNAHPYTGGHSLRVAYLARESGRRLGIPEWKLDEVVQAALLHDIGKIAVDERILEKPGKLTNDEFAEIKTHSVIGERIVSLLPTHREMADWICHHHEKVDGTGYPHGLAWGSIPLVSRLICVIDSYDAMTGSDGDGHKRLYRQPISKEEALAELDRCAGTQFDPKVVEIFTKVVSSQKEATLQ